MDDRQQGEITVIVFATFVILGLAFLALVGVNVARFFSFLHFNWRYLALADVLAVIAIVVALVWALNDRNFG